MSRTPVDVCPAGQNVHRIRQIDYPLSKSLIFSSSVPIPVSAPFLFTLSVLASLIALAGCTQPQTPGFYDPQRGNSITDSQYNGKGAQCRNVVCAPS